MASPRGRTRELGALARRQCRRGRSQSGTGSSRINHYYCVRLRATSTRLASAAVSQAEFDGDLETRTRAVRRSRLIFPNALSTAPTMRTVLSGGAFLQLSDGEGGFEPAKEPPIRLVSRGRVR